MPIEICPHWRTYLKSIEYLFQQITELTSFRFRQPGFEEIEFAEGKGGHGGADAAVFKDIFSNPPSPAAPTLMDGVQAVLTGCAVVESMKTGKKCKVQELL